MRKRSARLGTVLLVFAARFAAGAEGAQAHEWTINKTSLAKLGLASESLKFTSSSEFEFSTSFGGMRWRWRCAPTFSEASISQNGKGKLQMGFSGCTTIEPLPECKYTPYPNRTMPAELIEGGSVLYLKLSAPEGVYPSERLFGWHYGGSGNCQFSGDWFFQGSIAGLIVGAKNTQLEHKLEFSPSIGGPALGTELHFGKYGASMTGNFTTALSGPNAFKGWAGE